MGTKFKEKAKENRSKFKQKVNENSNRLKKKVKKRMPFNLFSKTASSYHESFECGYIPYSLQISNYTGHRTVETVKECNFFWTTLRICDIRLRL